MRILVIDDDAALREIVTRHGAKMGHEVVEAGTIASASDHLAHNGPFDLLIVDGLLPDGSGIDLISTIRTTESDATIFYASGVWRDPATFRNLTDVLSVDRVMAKPLTAQQIQMLLRDAESLFESRIDASGLDELFADHEPERQLEERLAELRGAFIETIDERLDRLEDQLERASSGDNEAMAPAHHEAHKLAGSFGTHGLLSASRALRRIDQGLQEIVDGVVEPFPLIWGDFLATLGDAREAVAIHRRAEAVSEGSAWRVLVVDPDRELASVLEEFADPNELVIERCVEADAAVAAVEEQDATVVVIHVGHVGRATAASIAHAVRTPFPSLAIVFAGAPVNDVELRVQAIHAGAQQVFTADTPGSLLLTHIRAMVVQHRAVPSVLVIDPDASVATAITDHLSHRGMRTRHVGSPSEIIGTLDKPRPDAIVASIRLPQVSGLDLVKILRASPQWQHVPILLIGQTQAAEERIAAYQAGADDCVQRPILLDEIVVRLRRHLDRARRLRHSAERDPSTGLLTRGSFTTLASRQWRRLQREPRPMSVAVIAVDMAAGDSDALPEEVSALRAALVELVLERFRPTDLRGQWDDFVVIGVGAEPKASSSLAMAKIVDDFAMLRVEVDGSTTSGTCSAGIAELRSEAYDVETAVRLAAERLRTAQQRGQGEVVS